jgi:hypothetical protein
VLSIDRLQGCEDTFAAILLTIIAMNRSFDHAGLKGKVQREVAERNAAIE